MRAYVSTNRRLKKAIHGLFQPAKQKARFLLCFIFQAHKPCLKNGGASLHRAQAVFQQPASRRPRAAHTAFALAAGLWLAAATVEAETTYSGDGQFTVQSGAVRLVDEVYLLDAQIEYLFSKPVLEALENGVPLVIELQIELLRQRDLLWDVQQARLSQRYQLSYHVLTEQYLVKNLNSAAQQSLTNAEAALKALGQVESLPLIDKRLLLEDEIYVVRLRPHLDIDALPTPMRLPAYFSAQWRLTGEWVTWPLQP